jgi:hypothetical protein
MGNKASKHDQEKVSYTTIPQLALREVAKSFTHGKVKYGMYNYSKGMENTRLIDAALRHITEFLLGNDLDEDSKRHHLSNAAASIMMALENSLSKNEEDLRNPLYKKMKNKPNTKI